MPSDEEEISSPRYPDEIVEPEDRKRTKTTTKKSNVVKEKSPQRKSPPKDVEMLTDIQDTVYETKSSLRRDDTSKSPAVPIVEADSIEFERLVRPDDLPNYGEQVLQREEHSETRNVDENTRQETKTWIPDNDVVVEDVALLTVNQKVSKFLDTAEKIIKPTENKCPVAKQPRATFHIEKDLENDECLLSVSEKVSKFITTAEQLTTPPQQERPKSPRCMNVFDQSRSRSISPAKSIGM